MFTPRFRPGLLLPGGCRTAALGHKDGELRLLIPFQILFARHRPWNAVWPVLIATLVSSAGARFTSQDCMECHSDREIMEGRDSLVVDEAILKKSVHADMECVDCHHVADIPHDEHLPAPACGECHEDAIAEYGRSVHGRAHAGGVPEAPWCADCHGGHDIAYVSDSLSKVSPRNQPATCGVCHSNPALVRKFYISVANPSAAYERSAHYRVLMGTARAQTESAELTGIEPPTCSTCHEGHRVLKASDPASHVYFGNVSRLCGRCHKSIFAIYRESVHGMASASGNRNAPTCASCHGEHSIESLAGGLSDAEVVRLSTQTCVGCHADQRLIQKSGFSALRVASYEQSYHGLAGQLGSTASARCASCHGTHNIRRSDDPRSQVYPANLVITCGHCHEGIGAQFASIRVHSVIAQEKTTPAGFVRIAYLYLIFGLIGGMILHNGVVFSRYLREKYRAQRRFRAVRRCNRFQIVQHMILFVSFTVLAMTGFALKFPTSWWVDLLQAVGFGEANRRLIHRVAAVVMVVQSLVQLVWFLSTRQGRRDLKALVPRLKDVTDLIHNIRYHLFRAEHPPRYARFDYTEKAEYLALIWGVGVMALTGFMLWYPNVFTKALPSWVIEVATVVHFYEALLATLAILVWHFFFVIYHPREYPMRFSWITGTLTEHDYRHHHPLEYEELRRDPNALIPPQHQEAHRAQQPPPSDVSSQS